MANFVDLRTPFSDDAPNQIVRDIDLLGLELLRWVLRMGSGRPWVRVASGITGDVR